MSEQLHHSSEQQHNTHEQTVQAHERLAEIERKAHETHHEHAEHIDQIRADIEQQALQKNEQAQDNIDRHDEQPAHHHYITRKIKAAQYKVTLGQIRQSLPKNQQRFSALVHQPAIEKISDVGAKTVARPSGIIGGGGVALIGSIAVLIIARHVGFEVPNSLFGGLFIIGFLLGVGLEATAKLIKRLAGRTDAKHRSHETY